jgi:hypothetical protein
MKTLTKQLLIALPLLGVIGAAVAEHKHQPPQSAVKVLPVPDNGLVAPNGGVIIVDLKDNVINDVSYVVSCHISNPVAPEALSFKLSKIDPNCQGKCKSKIYVNGKSIHTKDNTAQAYLKDADNIVIFGKVINPSQVPAGASQPSTTLVFQNLNNTTAASVGNCVAVPTDSI